MEVLIKIGIGELIDKITILRIKMSNISDISKKKNVHRELNMLEEIWEKSYSNSNLNDLQQLMFKTIAPLMDELQEVNKILWDTEDKIRMCEKNGHFGQDFIELARSVYKTNDRRAFIKRKINQIAQSSIVEEKFYS